MYGKTFKSLTKEKVLSSGLYLEERWVIANTSARSACIGTSDSCQEQRGETFPCTALDKTPINTNNNKNKHQGGPRWSTSIVAL